MRPDPAELFGTTDIIAETRNQIAVALQEVRIVGGFDSLESYFRRFTLDVPVLGDPHHKIGEDKSFPAGRESFERRCDPNTLIPGKEIIVRILFTGKPDIFRHMPSTVIPSGRQEGKVEENNLIARFGVLIYGTEPGNITQNIKARKKEIADRILRWFDLAKRDFDDWNDNLEAYLQAQIKMRKEAIENEALSTKP